MPELPIAPRYPHGPTRLPQTQRIGGGGRCADDHPAGHCGGSVRRGRAVDGAAHRDGAHRLRRHRRPGLRARQEPAEDPRLPDHGRLRHPPGAHRVGDEGHHRSGPSAADRLHARPARFRAAVRDRGARSRLQRDAVGVSRADHAGRDEEREAHGDGGARGDDGRGLLGDGRGGGEAQKALRADGELQLRPHRDDGLQHGPAGPVRRDPPRRRRLPARSARRSSSPTRARGSGGGRGRRS